MATSDTFALALALLGGGAIRHLLLGYSFLPLWAWILIPTWWCCASLTGLMPGWGLSAVDHLRRLFILVTAMCCLGTMEMFFFRSADAVSRLSIITTWALAIILVPALRTLARHILCVRGTYGMPTVVFGRASAATDVAARLLADRGIGYIPIGICSDDLRFPQEVVPTMGGMGQTAPLAPAAVIILAGVPDQEKRALVDRVLAGYRKVMILPDLGEIPSLLVFPRDVGGMIGLEISQTLLNPFATKIKRLTDLFLVTATIPFWLPLCATICCLIWFEDRNSPIYKQIRLGRGQNKFFAYKFRTMVPNAENVLHRHLEENPELRAEWEANFKLRRDPRITRVGQFLRKSSLDELPQLVNVLTGEMALVGPRPLPGYHFDQMPGFIRTIRSRVRPGITGLWQVSGRSDIGNEGMTRWDPYYVRNWSMWLDIVIIVRTVRAVVFGSGAR